MLSHLSGALLALLGLVALLRRATTCDLPRPARLGLAAYAGSLCFSFSASALFHYFPWNPDQLIFFKKLDHAAIFTLIAGTCTVLLLTGRTQRRRTWIAVCWIVCAGALLIKMIVWPMTLWASASIYLLVGWIAAASVLSALRHVARDRLRPLIYGMIVFSLAAIVFAAEAPVVWPGFVEGHELFHLIVLVGAALHFAFILRHCTEPGGLSTSGFRANAEAVRP